MLCSVVSGTAFAFSIMMKSGTRLDLNQAILIGFQTSAGAPLTLPWMEQK
jgi:hypothetical protein